MKKLIILLLFIPFLTFSQDCENYGESWTKIFQTKSKIQAEIIVFRYKLANIGQSYYKDNDKYIIEFSYCDDNTEKIKGIINCIPKRLIKKIKIIEFATIDGKEPINLGGFYLTF